MPLNQKKKKKNKLRKPLEANKRTSLRISTPPLSKLTPLTPPLTEKKAIKRSQKHVRRGEKKKKRRISQSLSSRAIRKESCSSRISNIEYIREYTRYLTAMSLFPRVNPTSSLKMKIRVAPRYHLMLWSPSHWGNFSTHGSCTSVPSSACFTLFSHGSLLPATTQRKRKKESSVNRPSFRFVSFSFRFSPLFVSPSVVCLRKGWRSMEEGRGWFVEKNVTVFQGQDSGPRLLNHRHVCTRRCTYIVNVILRMGWMGRVAFEVLRLYAGWTGGKELRVGDGKCGYDYWMHLNGFDWIKNKHRVRIGFRVLMFAKLKRNAVILFLSFFFFFVFFRKL